VFDRDFYNSEYTKNKVYEKLSSNETYAQNITEDITDNVLGYFHHKEELRYFTANEKSHMGDVRRVITFITYMYYACILLSIALFIYLYLKFRNDKYRFIKITSKSILYTGITVIVLLGLLIIFSVFYFDQLFTLFHLIVFPQGNWMFDSSSLLITVFPEQFFFDAALRIFTYAILQAIVFTAIGWWINKQLKGLERNHQ
jgi:integral membrane protein (TIGR01906 family)